jgi:hypothetical protein
MDLGIDIKSIDDLLKIIREIPDNNKIQVNLKGSRFFRGQSNYAWKLIPSVYRDGLFDSERILINEAIHKYPLEFNINDKFSTLVKMQHFGLKTRLLDLTENPLVALYFACNENMDEDGSIYIFNNVVTFYSYDQIVETYMDFIFKFSGNSCRESDLLGYFKNKEFYNMSRRPIENIEDLIYDLTLSGVFVSPKMDNVRIISQQGAFFMGGMKIKEIETSRSFGNYGRKYYHFEPNIIDDQTERVEGGQVFKYKIKKEDKKKILKELELLNITGATLFQDLEHQIKYINNSVIKNMLI